MVIKGHQSAQKVLGCKATKTAGGLTTWVEFFSVEDGSGKTSLIQGDTKEILELAEYLVKELKGESQDLRATFEAMDQEELDDQVHDAKAQEASGINNSGRSAQIEYLIKGV